MKHQIIGARVALAVEHITSGPRSHPLEMGVIEITRRWFRPVEEVPDKGGPALLIDPLGAILL
jgi:hypothetical protein